MPKITATDEAAKALKLETSAATDGSQNIPDSKSKTFSQTENKIESYWKELYDEKLKEYKNDFDGLLEEKNNLYSKYEEILLTSSIDWYKNKSSSIVVTYKTDLNNNTEDFIRVKSEYFNFKRENDLQRSHNKTKDFCIYISTTLFIIETILNAALLSSVLASGLIAGIALASGVALINILFSHIVGLYGLVQWNLNRTYKKIVAFTSLIIWAILIIYVNGALGVVRFLSLQSTGDGLYSDQQIIEHLSKALSPLAWPSIDFNSLFLIGVGILFALIALIDGYFMKDRYPGYSEKGDQYDKALEHLRNTLESTQIDLGEAYEEARDKFTKDRENKYKYMADIQNKLLQMKTEIENFKIDTKVFCDRTLSMIKMYRNINEQNRSTDPPEYFLTDALSSATNNYYQDNFATIHTNANLDQNFDTEKDGKIEFNKKDIESQAKTVSADMDMLNETQLDSTLKLYDETASKHNIIDEKI